MLGQQPAVCSAGHDALDVDRARPVVIEPDGDSISIGELDLALAVEGDDTLWRTDRLALAGEQVMHRRDADGHYQARGDRRGYGQCCLSGGSEVEPDSGVVSTRHRANKPGYSMPVAQSGRQA